MDPHKMRDERHRVLRPDPFTAELNALRSETARLRALLDERTALLRECLDSSFDIDEHNPDLADRVREAIKETTCDS